MLGNVPIRLLMVAVILTLTVPRMAYSLSIYDVIMLSQKSYEADKIITLIEATGSAFDLSAMDVTRLKEAGVSETVIQTMLAVDIFEPQKNTNLSLEPTAYQHSRKTDTSAAVTGSKSGEKVKRSLMSGDKLRSKPQLSHGTTSDQHASEQRHVASNSPAGSTLSGQSSQPSIVIKKSQLTQSTAVTDSGGVFTSMPVEEEGAGAHQHQAITFGNIKFLILRDEGAYSSVAARAASVVRRLQEIRSIGHGKFRANHANDGVHAVVFQTQEGREIAIISASWRDARAYQARSGRHVNPDILADYWSALFSDYWSILFRATAPSQLNNLHEGEALQTLSTQLSELKHGGVDRLTEVVGSLPREEYKHLELLATTVPREFGRDSDHEAEEQ